MAAPNFWLEIYYLHAIFFLGRGKRKKSQGGGLYKENRAEVLENSNPGSFKNDVILPAL